MRNAKNTKDCKGFTLAELLIVVAIIAVLVAVAIPVFSGQIDRAKAAADMANVRAAKAAAVAQYYEDGMPSGREYAFNGSSVTSDASSWSAIKGYGQSTHPVEGASYAPNTGGRHPNYVVVRVEDDGAIRAWWEVGAGEILTVSNRITRTTWGDATEEERTAEDRDFLEALEHNIKKLQYKDFADLMVGHAHDWGTVVATSSVTAEGDIRINSKTSGNESFQKILEETGLDVEKINTQMDYLLTRFTSGNDVNICVGWDWRYNSKNPDDKLTDTFIYLSTPHGADSADGKLIKELGWDYDTKLAAMKAAKSGG